MVSLTCPYLLQVNKLIGDLPEVVHYYLRHLVFPDTMKFQRLKISACGHELGSDILFGRRVGFSGTPSNLMPSDLGECKYEDGSDGKMINYLTSPSIVSTECLPSGWSSKSLLQHVCKHDPPIHALIDTGALVTGMDNVEVAEYLLFGDDSFQGLEPWFKGVVYLDKQDRQMVLLRASGRAVSLAQCGLPFHSRFTFYDQIHTTGMDIKQAPDAIAVATVGKDMVFRDYAQGCFRMRGIGIGQTIVALLIPEVAARIEKDLASVSDSFEITFVDGKTSQDVPLSMLYTRDASDKLVPLSSACTPVAKGAEVFVWKDAHTSVKGSVDAINRLLITNADGTINFACCVPAWLMLNSMTLETLQDMQLSTQEVYNSLRKGALFELKKEIAESKRVEQPPVYRVRRFTTVYEPSVSDAPTASASTSTRDAVKGRTSAIGIYREIVSTDVDAGVPETRSFVHMIDDMISSYLGMDMDEIGKTFSRDKDKAVLEFAKLATAASHIYYTPENFEQTFSVRQKVQHSGAVMSEQPGNLGQEREQQQEQEQEQQKVKVREQERQKMSQFGRDEEHSYPWLSEKLVHDADVSAVAPLTVFKSRDPAGLKAFSRLALNENPFYPLNVFQTRQTSVVAMQETDSIQQRIKVSEQTPAPKVSFPGNLLVSSNWFKPSWTGLKVHRLKNVVFVLEWMPKVNKENRRYLTVLTLAEAETVRRIIHTQRYATVTDSSNPLLSRVATSLKGKVQMALRIVSGHVLDQTSGFTPEDVVCVVEGSDAAVGDADVSDVAVSDGEASAVASISAPATTEESVASESSPTAESATVTEPSTTETVAAAEETESKEDSKNLTVSTGMQCLRFFNNEMFYTDREVDLIMNALCMCTPTDRRDFFEECLRRRRRERMLWDVTPVAKVFTATSKWDLLRSLALVRLVKDQLRINFVWARNEKFKLDRIVTKAEFAQIDVESKVRSLIEMFPQLGTSLIRKTLTESKNDRTAAAEILFRKSTELRKKETARQRRMQKSGWWACEMCTLVNKATLEICSACGSPIGNALIIQEEGATKVVEPPPAAASAKAAETSESTEAAAEDTVLEEIKRANEAQTIFDQEMAEQPKTAQELFDRFANATDKAQEKSLDRGAISALLQFFGFPCTSEDVRGIIELGDRTSNGMLGLKEFLELFEPKIADVVVKKKLSVAQELQKNWKCPMCNQENYYKNTACIFGCGYVHNTDNKTKKATMHTKPGHWYARIALTSHASLLLLAYFRIPVHLHTIIMATGIVLPARC